MVSHSPAATTHDTCRHRFLPDAYQGRNDYIRETIVQTVVNYNSFMTTEVLPWKQQVWSAPETERRN